MFTRIQRVFAGAIPKLRPALVFSCATLIVSACGVSHSPCIAVIPQTEGLSIWDAVHVGTESQAQRSGVSIYWNAPTREDDVEAQIAFVERVASNHYQGLVLAPDQSLALISPVRHVLARDIPTAIIYSPLPLPHDPNLISIVNDDELGGRMAAQRVSAMLRSHGSVAILGMNPDIAGVMTRARSFERALARSSPGIQIVERHAGSFNASHEQQAVEDTLRTHPHLDVIVALTWDTADGALRSLESGAGPRATRVVAFDSIGIPPFEQWPRLDSVIQPDTRAMGRKAIEAISIRLRHGAMPPDMVLPPRLITRDNYNSAEVRQMFSADLELWNWRWSLIK